MGEELSFMEGKEEDNEEVVKFLNQHFLHQEPMNLSIGLCDPGYRMPYFDTMVTRHLQRDDTLVLLARDALNRIMGLTVFIMESSGSNSPTESHLPIDRC